MADPQSSIRSDVSRKFVLFGTLPLLAVGVLMVWLTFSHLRTDLLAKQQQRVVTVSRLLENALDRYLYDATLAIEANALRMQGLADWRPVLRSYILRQPSVAELALYDPEGNEQFRINRDLLVSERSEQSADIARLALQVAETRLPTVLDIHRDAVSGEPLLTVATPFFDLAERRLDYIVVSEHRLKPLSLLLSELPAVHGTTFYLIDTDQRLLAHQNPSVALRESTHWDASITSADPGSLRRSLTGEFALVSTQTILLEDRRLIVVTEDSIWSAVTEHAQILFGLMILIAFSAMTHDALRRTVSRRVVEPVEKLSQAAERVASGDLQTRTEIDGSDEVARLSRTFDSMVQNVSQAEAELRAKQLVLEQTVRERTAALEDAKAAEDRFRRLFEYTNVGNIVVDRVGRIETSNATAQGMFGYGADELVGTAIAKLIPNWDTVTISADVPSGQAPHVGRGVELAGFTRDGQELGVHLSVGEVEHDGRKGFILSISDITEQQGLQRQVAQSQRMDAIGQLTGGVAHDFNNLLAVILGNLELLRLDINDPDKVELIDASLEATSRGAELTRNMLSFARKAQLAPTVVDLNAIIQNMKTWITRTLPASVEVETSLLAGLWPVKVDASLTENALLNLILNARDAMSSGGKLTIETANVRVDEEYVELRGEEIEPGRYVLLAVSDTGTGIAPEIAERIFEPFYSTKTQTGGSGMGLAMIQGFMRQSRGTVRVYSEPGTGTTFKLYFPAGATGQPKHPTQPRRSEAVAGGDGSTLLLVEDNIQVLRALQRMLTNAGYLVLSANDGTEAISIFEEEADIDVVLTDIVMPGPIQGTDLAKKLRARRPDLPIVFMSGYAAEATVHGNGLRPEDVRLMKPIRQAELLTAVQRSMKTAVGDV